MLTANNTIISNTLNCSAEQALKVESYINKGRMLDWNTASKSLINTIARAVNDKLLRDVVPAKKAVTKATVKVTRKPSFGRQEAPQPPRKKSNKAPQAGTKIAHAMEVYKAMEVDGVRSSRQDIISAMANSMQIEKKAAAGYYQKAKKLTETK